MARAPYISRARTKELQAEHERLVAAFEQLQQQEAVLRAVFTHTIAALRAVTYDVVPPPEGTIRWAQVQTEAGSMQMTVWFEAAADAVASPNGERELVAVASDTDREESPDDE